ncbi:MAG: condensation domain-containing protein, partial [Pyrinomonadaceae bacterium]
EQLEQCGAVKLPVDYPDGTNTIGLSSTVVQWLDAEATRALLQEVPKAYRTQINDVLLTALAEAIGKWTGQRQVLLDMEGHGREDLWEDLDLSRTVGWFTTLFPVMFETSRLSQPGAFLKSVKEQLRRIPNHGIGYGLLRYLSNDTEVSEGLRALPQAEVRFNYLGQLDQALPVNSLFSLSNEPTGAERNAKQRPTYLLDVTSAVSKGQLRLTIIYSESIHRRASVELLSNHLIEALRSIISHCQSLESADFSPSDFPLASLTQQQLDRIMSRTGGAGHSNDN